MAKLKDEDLRQYIKAGEPIAGKADGGGLTFTLSRGRTASWVFRYRHGGKQREMTLGNYPDLPLKQARIAATAARARWTPGSTWRTKSGGAAAAKSFRQVADDYLRLATDLAPRTQREYRRYLQKDLLRRLGSRVAREIGPENIVGTVEKIAERSDTVARHAFELLTVIFAHALARNSVKVNPCAGLRLVSILGPRPPRRARLKLTADELRSVAPAGSFDELPRRERLADLAHLGARADADRRRCPYSARAPVPQALARRQRLGRRLFLDPSGNGLVSGALK